MKELIACIVIKLDKKKIRREITRCLHKVKDLNDQYEKATRYLRKSLNDIKKLIKKHDVEKSVMYEGLDKDLSKALNVVKEIEYANDLIEQYHNAANKQNFEVIAKEKPEKKENKKKD